ncbi:hypothetical protein [Gaetbulibacter aestuarii]|uniref:DUF4375 domain-containing protein n=1 Tax=Gaetbulibacter aestuarii TaxID=1502358 RepID=A0ABW7MYW3_9FLAO
MSTGLFIIVLVIIIVMVVFMGKKSVFRPKKFKKSSLTENPYRDFRDLAMRVTPEQLHLQLEKDKDLYGMIMDWNMGNAIATVVSFKTGDASVYLSTGQAFIGGFDHESIQQAAKHFLAVGTQYLIKATKTERTEPTNDQKIDFYFLTKSGRYYLEEDIYKIKNRTSELLELFESGNQVTTEYRLLEEKNG